MRLVELVINSLVGASDGCMNQVRFFLYPGNGVVQIEFHLLESAMQHIPLPSAFIYISSCIIQSSQNFVDSH